VVDMAPVHARLRPAPLQIDAEPILSSANAIRATVAQS